MKLKLGYNCTRVHIKCGDIAQLGEHLLCTQGVVSSILIVSTILLKFLYSSAYMRSANLLPSGGEQAVSIANILEKVIACMGL